MYFNKLVLGELNTNCYILSGDGRQAVVIDPAYDYPLIEKTLRDAGLTACAVLLTHAHLDHYAAIQGLIESGAATYMNFADKPLIGDDFGFGYHNPPVFSPDLDAEDGQILTLAGLTIRVIHTPGHSAGSVCYLIGDMLFSGDTLFFDFVGRTDFPSGSRVAIKKSVKEKLYTLPPDTRVFPGHDAETTIGRERKFNLSVRD